MAPTGSDEAHLRRAYAATAHGQIHYRHSGPGGTRSPLLLLHPAPTSSAVFESFMREIGRDRAVVAPDLPGYGMSDAPATPPQIAEYAQAMLALEDTLGLGLFDVMGYHTGGLIAAEMARQQPQAVRKIVMVSALILDDATRAMLRDFKPRTLDERAGAFAHQWKTFKTDFWRMGNDDVRTWNLFVEAQRNPLMASWCHRAAAEYDLAAALLEIAQPVLILNPEDELTAATNRAAPLLKNGSVYDLPGWTHGFLDARTAEITEIVRGFLDH